MIIKKLNKEHAIILCGHGSRDSDYKREILSLKIKLEEKFQYDVFNCFIEINEPSIDGCVEEIIHKYKKILFFPLLLFDGKHMIKDIKKRINELSKKFKKHIYLVSKVSLVQEVLPNMKDIISKYKYKDYDALITSCSFSKNKTVIDQLENYTNKLSTCLNIKNKIFHFVGDEGVVLSELKKLRITNIIHHPVFFLMVFCSRKTLDSLKNILRLCKFFQSHTMIQ